MNTLDCPSDLVCNESLGLCTECLQDGDCAGGLCIDGVCRSPCASDQACREAGELCDFERGICVGCLGDEDCGEDEFCWDDECRADLCTFGQARCPDRHILYCTATGSGYRAFLCDNGCQQEPVSCLSRDPAMGEDFETLAMVCSRACDAKSAVDCVTFDDELCLDICVQDGLVRLARDCVDQHLAYTKCEASLAPDQLEPACPIAWPADGFCAMERESLLQVCGY